MQKTALIVTVAAALALPIGSASADKPEDPNCLGTDVSDLEKRAQPLGQNVVNPLADGGFNDEILGHLQGVPPVSTCPDNGFPSHQP